MAGLQPVMRPVLREAERIWQSHGESAGVTITEGTGGVHSAGSWHYYGYALDLRTRYFSDDQKAVVYVDLKQSLPGYYVVEHSTHIHVEIGDALAKQLGVYY